MREAIRSSPDALIENWSFTPSSHSLSTTWARARARWTGRAPPPRYQVLIQPAESHRWNCLFLYVPTGVLDPDQQQILARVAKLDGRLLVVFASPDQAVPVGLGHADALIWKELRGFDFSAYRIALEAVARWSPGAIAFLQNDSVLGPFGDLDALVAAARWDLTGFLGTRAVENHLSSYAFVIRDVTPERLAQLTPVMSPNWCCDRFQDVVMLQETRFARIAARAMSVGALLYMPLRPASRTVRQRLAALAGQPAPAALDLTGDPTLGFPLQLVARGHPFLKRSLFTKFAGLEDAGRLRAHVRDLGWTLAP